MDDKNYPLTKNFNQTHTLHGGVGLHRKKFNYTCLDNKLIFKRYSPHLEDGFFGDCDIIITYELKQNALILTMHATTQTRAYINLTNHVSFNLNQDKDKTILNHKLWIDADKMIEIDQAFMPSKIVPIDEVFNFKTPKRIEKDINNPHQQLLIAKGYDHPYILNKSGLREVATLEVSDLRLRLATTQPSLVLYSGNFIPNGLHLTTGQSHHRGAVALEAQGIPNNQEFETYKHHNIITKAHPLNEIIMWTFET